MGTLLTGTVRGTTLEFDQAVEHLDGQWVLVVLEPLVESAMLAAETAEAWQAWVERGPDGPIDDPWSSCS
jgi:hypothetical protein